jgi:Domain of unknown function (DUF4383)
MAKIVCKIIGIALLPVGILGFFVSDLLGLHLVPVHNVIHIATSLVCLYFGFAASTKAAHSFCQVFGVVYLLVAILGFILPDILVSLLMGHKMSAPDSLIMDNIVHLLLGIVFMAAGLIRSESQPATAA